MNQNMLPRFGCPRCGIQYGFFNKLGPRPYQGYYFHTNCKTKKEYYFHTNCKTKNLFIYSNIADVLQCFCQYAEF